MPGDDHRLALHGIQQLPKAVLGFDRGDGDHGRLLRGLSILAIIARLTGLAWPRPALTDRASIAADCHDQAATSPPPRPHAPAQAVPQATHGHVQGRQALLTEHGLGVCNAEDVPAIAQLPAPGDERQAAQRHEVADAVVHPHRAVSAF